LELDRVLCRREVLAYVVLEVVEIAANVQGDEAADPRVGMIHAKRSSLLMNWTVNWR
jgi:hypothetical protein